jgi:predicted kinase
MAKLSPAYREDSSDILPPEIKEYLNQHYLKSLANLNSVQPKLAVLFSGGNSVGKSTIAARISKDLKGLILENDAIKVNLMKFSPTLSRDELSVLTWNYSIDLYKRIDQLSPNGLLVRDGVIDWYYDRILPIFLEHNYPIFIVAFDLSEEKQLQLIKERGDKPTVTSDRLITILKDHAIHTKRFRSVHTPDITLNDSNVFDHDAVINKLRQRLLQLKQSSD